MKKILYIVVFALSTVGFAQNSIEPQIDAQGNLVKATYFHDNGKVQQEGTFKDGKLDGKWTSYNEDGSIKQVAYYKDGMKTGTWITYNNNIVAQKIAYSNDGLISKK
jgi:antitoxin component YwqK of YwqJK toxin-antitoxin module